MYNVMYKMPAQTYTASIAVHIQMHHPQHTFCCDDPTVWTEQEQRIKQKWTHTYTHTQIVAATARLIVRWDGTDGTSYRRSPWKLIYNVWYVMYSTQIQSCCCVVNQPASCVRTILKESPPPWSPASPLIILWYWQCGLVWYIRISFLVRK